MQEAAGFFSDIRCKRTEREAQVSILLRKSRKEEAIEPVAAKAPTKGKIYLLKNSIASLKLNTYLCPVIVQKAITICIFC